MVITIGCEAMAIAKVLQDATRNGWAGGVVHSFEQWEDGLEQFVADQLQPGDLVLLKGSRACRLERLIPFIEKRFTPASTSTAA